jgi:hypothetical protein
MPRAITDEKAATPYQADTSEVSLVGGFSFISNYNYEGLQSFSDRAKMRSRARLPSVGELERFR